METKEEIVKNLRSLVKLGELKLNELRECAIELHCSDGLGPLKEEVDTIKKNNKIYQ